MVKINTVPAKQLIRFGNMEDLQINLRPREMGLCEDGIVYIKNMLGELFPIGMKYKNGVGIEVGDNNTINLVERSTYEPNEPYVIQGALHVVDDKGSHIKKVKIGTSGIIGALVPIPEGSLDADKVLSVIDGRGTVGWVSQGFESPDGSLDIDGSLLEGQRKVYITIPPNSIDVEKLTASAKNQLENPFITPEEFGAVGDGVGDDTLALQAAIDKSIEEDKPVFLSNTYKITSVIYITSAVTILGRTSKGTKIFLSNNAHFELKRDTGDHWVYEVRMKHFCIYAENECDYCITSNHVASQCFFEDIYMEKAVVSCVKMRGSILYFKDCYFYYSQVAAQLRGNAIYFENCNFWENITAFKCYDDAGISFLHLSNCWIEHSNVVFDTNGNSITCSSEGTAFQGSSIPGYKMLVQTQDDKPNVNLSFVQCRLNFPYETGILFKIVNEALGNGGNSLLKFTNCYVAIPQADYLIDNSEASIGTLAVIYEGSSPVNHIFSNEGTRGAYVGPLMDYRHFARFDSGLVIGKNKPAIDSVIEERVGYLRYDEYNDQLYCVNGDGRQTGIPWKTSTYLQRLSQNNNNLAQDVDDIRERLNDLIYIMKYQGKMLQIGNRDGSLSTEVKIGNSVYPVIKIGNYYWIAEDLHEEIGEEGVDYVINENGAYLYKWSALCQSSGIESDALLTIKPIDWKIPNETQWTNLVDNLVGSSNAEKALTMYGENAFDGYTGNNSTGFTAIANGYNNGQFVDVGLAAKYHSSNASLDLLTVGLFTLQGNNFSYSNSAGSSSYRSCRLCMRI